MGHIIALPYLKNLIDPSTGKPMLNELLLMDQNKKLNIFFFLNLYLYINGFYKEIKVDQNINCIGLKPRWVYAHVDNFLTIQARELCVLSPGEIRTFDQFSAQLDHQKQSQEFQSFYLQGVIAHSAPPPTTTTQLICFGNPRNDHNFDHNFDRKFDSNFDHKFRRNFNSNFDHNFDHNIDRNFDL